MKNFLQGLTFMALLSTTLSAAAIEQAGYFRIWQGFAKSNLTQGQFLNELPSFMKETVDLYRDQALNNYIVIIPPANKPAYVPDELALVALNSKENYESIRSTPAGQAYSNRHWVVFNKENSKSTAFVDYGLQKPTSLVHNTAYDMIGNKINWAAGYNAVFVGTKKSNLSSADFLQQLQKHIELAKAVMQPKGLRGYILIAHDQYEVAYLNWESQEAHDLAGQTEDGKSVFADAGRFMDILMYQEAIPFLAGTPVKPDQAYSILQP